jgi:hypothetical protein
MMLAATSNRSGKMAGRLLKIKKASSREIIAALSPNKKWMKALQA